MQSNFPWITVCDWYFIYVSHCCIYCLFLEISSVIIIFLIVPIHILILILDMCSWSQLAAVVEFSWIFPIFPNNDLSSLSFHYKQKEKWQLFSSFDDIFNYFLWLHFCIFSLSLCMFVSSVLEYTVFIYLCPFFGPFQ